MTAKSLIKSVRKLAKQYPNVRYKHEDKSYFTGDVFDGDKFIGQGCLIGQALQRNNFRLHKHSELFIDDYLKEHRVPADNLKQIQWLRTVQEQQDDGRSWGRCVEFADKKGKQ